MPEPVASAPPMDTPKQLSPEPMVMEDDFLEPVPPFYEGQGFPYAPTNWPNLGDTWGWKVGRRISSCGYYTDRFLIPPRSLQNPACPKYFASKRSFELYIQKEFPDVDIDAFFASFIWRVPSTLWHSTKVRAASLSSKKVGEEEKEETHVTAKRRKKRTAAASLAKRTTRKREKRPTRHSLRQSVPGSTKDTDGKIDSFSLNEEAATPGKGMKSTSDYENDQPGSDSIEGNDSYVKCMPENFDSYIDSMDNILAQPLSGASLVYAATNSSTKEEELAEAQSKLYSLLDMDFHSLVNSKNIYKLVRLASNLQKDPNLSPESLLKLKLIEEIPSYGKVFVENKRITEQAKYFFTILEEKKAKALSLKKEYYEMKEKAAQIQTELESDTLAVKEIDDRIAKLQSEQAEHVTTIKIKNRTKVKLNNDQQKLVNAIIKIVQEVQLENSKKAEWEMKKENATKHEAEILARFGPLKGFSL